MPKAKPVKINGKQYPSLRSAARGIGVNYGTVKNRVRAGISAEEALLAPVQKQSTGSITVGGDEYPSLSDAARKFGISPSLACERRRRGFSLEQALGIDEISWAQKPKSIVLEGIEYPSRAEACRYYGFDEKFIDNRLNLGWSIDEAFEVTEREKYDKEVLGLIYVITCKRTGKKYVGQTRGWIESRWEKHLKKAQSDVNVASGSLTEHIRIYGEENFVVEEYGRASTNEELNRLEIQTISELNTKVPFGMNITRGGSSAISTGIKFTVGIKEFDSFSEACRHFDMNEGKAYRRKMNGWSPEEIFGIKERKKHEQGDSLEIGGMRFRSQRAAMRYFKSSMSKVHWRVNKSNWTWEQALELEPPPSFAASNITVSPFYRGKKYATVELLANDYHVDGEKLRVMIKQEGLQFKDAIQRLQKKGT
ncbi:GIY-YIG nuclease family protein [Akkermansiaceae bacterium]|nr:GIY-YIG nuclease family protein [Akkermansiaceae bacterium]MDB4376783.1 GIY-YIG nuclease family protein [Akkermansiaceae bacterium]